GLLGRGPLVRADRTVGRVLEGGVRDPRGGRRPAGHSAAGRGRVVRRELRRGHGRRGGGRHHVGEGAGAPGGVDLRGRGGVLAPRGGVPVGGRGAGHGRP